MNQDSCISCAPVNTMKPTPFFIKGADRGKVCASLHLRVHDSRFDLTVSTRLRVSVDEWQLPRQEFISRLSAVAPPRCFSDRRTVETVD